MSGRNNDREKSTHSRLSLRTGGRSSRRGSFSFKKQPKEDEQSQSTKRTPSPHSTAKIPADQAPLSSNPKAPDRRQRFKTYKQQSHLSMQQLLEAQKQVEAQGKPEHQYLIIRADQLFDTSEHNKQRLSKKNKPCGELDLVLDGRTYPFAAGCLKLLHELTLYYGVRLVLIDNIRLQSQESLLEKLFEQAEALNKPTPFVFYKIFCGDSHVFFDADEYTKKHAVLVKAHPKDMTIDEIARTQDTLKIPDKQFYFHQVICEQSENLSDHFSVWTPDKNKAWDFQQLHSALWNIYRVMVTDRTPRIAQYDLDPAHLNAFQNLVQYGSYFAWMLRTEKNPPEIFSKAMSQAQLAQFSGDLEFIGKQFKGMGYCDWQALSELMSFIKSVDHVDALHMESMKKGLKKYTKKLKETGQDGGEKRWLDNNSRSTNFLIDFNRTRNEKIRDGIPSFLKVFKRKIEPELANILNKGQELEARRYYSASFEMYRLYNELKARTDFIFRTIDNRNQPSGVNETYRSLFQILETAHDCLERLEQASRGQLAQHRGYKQTVARALALFISLLTLVPMVLLYLGVIHLPTYKTDSQKILDSTKEIFEDPHVIYINGVKA